MSTYLTIHEVAERLKISHMTTLRLVNGGALQASRVGRQYRIAESELERFLIDNRTTAGAP